MFVAVQYDLVDANGQRLPLRRRLGVLRHSQGWFATSKHVAQPWKFSADICRLIDQGYRLDEGSILYGAGARARPSRASRRA